jgi:hypothetical protein
VNIGGVKLRKDRSGGVPGTRICNTCQEQLPESAFGINRARFDGLCVTCKVCACRKAKERRDANPDLFRAQERAAARIRWDDPVKRARIDERDRAYRMQRRRELIDAYGGKCACCGEHRLEFLAIDHPDNDGAEHRRIAGSGERMHLWLRKHGFPPGYRVLCHNCNCAFGFYGGCPHDGNDYALGAINPVVRQRRAVPKERVGRISRRVTS